MKFPESQFLTSLVAPMDAGILCSWPRSRDQLDQKHVCRPNTTAASWALRVQGASTLGFSCPHRTLSALSQASEWQGFGQDKHSYADSLQFSKMFLP